jgi:hypothetical protein
MFSRAAQIAAHSPFEGYLSMFLERSIIWHRRVSGLVDQDHRMKNEKPLFFAAAIPADPVGSNVLAAKLLMSPVQESESDTYVQLVSVSFATVVARRLCSGKSSVCDIYKCSCYQSHGDILHQKINRRSTIRLSTNPLQQSHRIPPSSFGMVQWILQRQMKKKLGRSWKGER